MEEINGYFNGIKIDRDYLSPTMISQKTEKLREGIPPVMRPSAVKITPVTPNVKKSKDYSGMIIAEVEANGYYLPHEVAAYFFVDKVMTISQILFTRGEDYTIKLSGKIGVINTMPYKKFNRAVSMYLTIKCILYDIELWEPLYRDVVNNNLKGLGGIFEKSAGYDKIIVSHKLNSNMKPMFKKFDDESLFIFGYFCKIAKYTEKLFMITEGGHEIDIIDYLENNNLYDKPSEDKRNKFKFKEDIFYFSENYKGCINILSFFLNDFSMKRYAKISEVVKKIEPTLACI